MFVVFRTPARCIENTPNADPRFYTGCAIRSPHPRPPTPPAPPRAEMTEEQRLADRRRAVLQGRPHPEDDLYALAVFGKKPDPRIYPDHYANRKN